MSAGFSIDVALPGAPPVRFWLDQWSWIFPTPLASRLLLLADCVPLVLFGLQNRSPLITVPLSLIVGWFTLLALSMLLTDFYAGLFIFHLCVATGALILLRRRQWVGIGLLFLSLISGLVT